MKVMTGGAIVLSVLMATTASDIRAQDASADSMGRRGRRIGGQGVEMIMSMRERLELTEDQLASLEEMRRGSVEMRNARAAEMAEMRSQLQAGQIRPSEMMAFMEDRRDAAADVAAGHQERIEGILNEAQLETLQATSRRGRRSARGSRGGAGWQGRAGFRNGRGHAPGMRRGQMRHPRGFRGARGSGRGGQAGFRRGGGGFGGNQPGPGR
jgi:hypothetical protein